MKLGRLKLVGIAALACAQPTTAQTADQWERGTDPATARSGLQHIDSGIFFSCSSHGGLVWVTAPDLASAAIKPASGTASAMVVEKGVQEGKAYAVVPADDPALLAAATGPLSVAGRDLGFSEKDRRYFGLFLRICKAS